MDDGEDAVAPLCLPAWAAVQKSHMRLSLPCTVVCTALSMCDRYTERA
jgi:hypothetical protein